MAWILWLMAMAAWFATSASCGSDRATPQIAKSRDLIGNVGPLLFEGFQRLGHGHRGSLLILAYYIRTEWRHKKRDQPFHHFQSAHPLASGHRRENPHDTIME
jgi:hypothetical protein